MKKNRSLFSALIAGLLLNAIPGLQGASQPLPRSTPEAQGISSQSVCDFVAAADKVNTLHSFMKLAGAGWRVAVEYAARLATEHVPDRGPAAIGIPGALDLRRRGRGTPHEGIWEGGQVLGYHLWQRSLNWRRS